MEKIPIIKVGDTLLVSIQTDLQDQVAMAMQSDLLSKIETTSARGVIIDISVVDIVDSFLGRVLSDTASMARIMNAVVVVVGIQPSVAITLVELGLELKQIPTALNVERGLLLLREKLGGSDGRADAAGSEALGGDEEIARNGHG
ncbi:MAG: STAS domain-containing protein [Candidatus Manganitrophaceae bacterium]|nr:MAG: STAS domain-containing protein [Candidatus Manganitrophaceae bacterium]